MIENVKNCLFLEGRKASSAIKSCMKDICTLKRPYVKPMNRHNDFTPFEDQTPLETLANKSDCHLFVFGSTSKKRPDNLVMGRLFDNEILDMIEFGIKSFKSLHDFKNEKIGTNVKPCLVFNGYKWKLCEELRRIKSLLIDMFHIENVSSFYKN